MIARHRKSQGWVLASLVVTAGLVAPAAGPSSPQPSRQPAPLPQVMRVKLDHAQEVLRALVTEDFGALERAATALGALTRQPAWGLLKTPEYARHSADFLRETDNLAGSARAGDLAAATLDYAAVTARCVQCHRHVRGQRAAD